MTAKTRKAELFPDARAIDAAQGHGTRAMRGLVYPTRRCPCCGRLGVPLRGVGQFKGNLFKHKLPDSRSWCVYHGDPDNPPDYMRRYNPDGTLISDNASPSGTGYIPPDWDCLAEAAPSKRDQLAQWWRDKADAEINMVVDKAIEYGATDLRDIGIQILEMGNGERPNSEADAYATEVGIVFYVLGKVSRLVAAVKEGRQPSLDTWLDIGIYARMAQRVHETGAWPGV